MLFVKEGWRVLEAADAVAMDRQLESNKADVVVLDLNLPGEGGLSICKRISQPHGPAILMLTARTEDIDRIVGLELGADDYLGKPFHPRELVARVRALLRRIQRPVADDVLVGAGLRVDLRARTVRNTEGEVHLSGAEFELLAALMQPCGRVITRDELLERVHGRPALPFDRSIDVLVSRLRRKIDGAGPTVIESVRNHGYVLRDPR